MKWARLVTVAFFAVYFLRALFSPHEYLFIYNVDFVFHEAGHLFFSPFGELITNLGGTLMQLLLPTAACLYFAKERKYFSAALVLVWVGENWINISIYARDARSRLLPLHGGDAVTHDWSEILFTLGLLHYDKVIGNLFYVLGALCMVIGLGFALYFSFELERVDQN